MCTSGGLSSTNSKSDTASFCRAIAAKRPSAVFRSIAGNHEELGSCPHAGPAGFIAMWLRSAPPELFLPVKDLPVFPVPSTPALSVCRRSPPEKPCSKRPAKDREADRRTVSASQLARRSHRLSRKGRRRRWRHMQDLPVPCDKDRSPVSEPGPDRRAEAMKSGRDCSSLSNRRDRSRSTGKGPGTIPAYRASGCSENRACAGHRIGRRDICLAATEGRSLHFSSPSRKSPGLAKIGRAHV